MSRTFVFNSSPTIILAKIGRLDLVSSLASEVWLPESVASEILQGPSADPARQAVLAGWGQRIATTIPPEIQEWGLGAGESSVLSVLRELGRGIAVLDDAKARQCAKAFQLPVIGTLGLILLAKKEGKISQARPVFQEILQAGLFLEEDLLQRVLSQVGEIWDKPAS